MSLTLIDTAVRFGIEGNDGQDYTAELQAALGLALKSIRNGDPCTIRLPPGDIRHSETVRVVGTQAGAPALLGTYGDGIDTHGTRLMWTGPADGLQMHAEFFNRGRIEDIFFDGVNVAGRHLNIAGTAYGDPSRATPSSGFSLRRCKFYRVRPGVPGNGCVALGTSPVLTGGETRQVDNWAMEFCDFVPESEGAPGFSWSNVKGFGVKPLSPGNTKNGHLLKCNFNVCDAAWDGQDSSGFTNISSATMGNVRRPFVHNGGNLKVLGASIECANVTDFRLLSGTGQLGCFASLENVEAVWDLPPGITPILLHWGGSLHLARSRFGFRDLATPFVMMHGAVAATTFGSFLSEQNWYQGCGADRPYIPLWDTSGNDLAPLPNTYGGVQKLRVKSWGDLGGSASQPLRLREFDSTLQG